MFWKLPPPSPSHVRSSLAWRKKKSKIKIRSKFSISVALTHASAPNLVGGSVTRQRWRPDENKQQKQIDNENFNEHFRANLRHVFNSFPRDLAKYWCDIENCSIPELIPARALVRDTHAGCDAFWCFSIKQPFSTLTNHRQWWQFP